MVFDVIWNPVMHRLLLLLTFESLRLLFSFSAARVMRPLAIPTATRVIGSEIKTFSTRYNAFPLFSHINSTIGFPQKSLLSNKRILDISSTIAPAQIRTVTKFSLKKGKRKTVKAALKRFFRLDWGGWIRPKVGRNKKLWKKSLAQKRRLRQHVLCNATQCTMLDKMVTKFWKRPKHYVEDPYAPYHTREEFAITRRKPVIKY